MCKSSLLGSGNIICMSMFLGMIIWGLLPGTDHFSCSKLPTILYLWLKPGKPSPDFCFFLSEIW